MTDRRLGEVFSGFVGRVVDVNDPTKSGRVRVRVFGMHDDDKKIPDEDLIWAQVIQSPLSAGFNKVGSSPHGLVKGSVVTGRFLDPAKKMIPLIDGVIAKAGDPVKNSETNSGRTQLVEGTNATPPAGRVQNKKFHTRHDVDVKEEDKNPKERKDSEAKDVVGDVVAKAKFAAMGTIGALKSGAPVSSLLKMIDPSGKTSVFSGQIQQIESLVSTLSRGSNLDSGSSASASTDVYTLLRMLISLVLKKMVESSTEEVVFSRISKLLEPEIDLMLEAEVTAWRLAISDYKTNSSPLVSTREGSLVLDLVDQALDIVKSTDKTILVITRLLLALLSSGLSSLSSESTSSLDSLAPALAQQALSAVVAHINHPNSVFTSGQLGEAINKFKDKISFLKTMKGDARSIVSEAVKYVEASAGTNSVLKTVAGLSSTLVSRLVR